MSSGYEKLEAAAAATDDDDASLLPDDEWLLEAARSLVRARTERHRVVRALTVAAMATISVMCVVLGAKLLINAADVLDGYTTTQCRVNARQSSERECAYYNVSLHLHEPGTAEPEREHTVCGVPAEVAREREWNAALACQHDALGAATTATPLEPNTTIECFAPRSGHRLVAASECAAVATARGAFAEFYSAYAHNFVFLGPRAQGLAAVHATTRSARDAGVALIIAGGVLGVVIATMVVSNSIGDYCAHYAERAQLVALRRRLAAKERME